MVLMQTAMPIPGGSLTPWSPCRRRNRLRPKVYTADSNDHLPRFRFAPPVFVSVEQKTQKNTEQNIGAGEAVPFIRIFGITIFPERALASPLPTTIFPLAPDSEVITLASPLSHLTPLNALNAPPYSWRCPPAPSTSELPPWPA